MALIGISIPSAIQSSRGSSVGSEPNDPDGFATFRVAVYASWSCIGFDSARALVGRRRCHVAPVLGAAHRYVRVSDTCDPYAQSGQI